MVFGFFGGMQAAGSHRVLCDVTTRWSQTTWKGVSLRRGRKLSHWDPQGKDWWQQWTDINIKLLSVLAGGSSLAPQPKLGIQR